MNNRAQLGDQALVIAFFFLILIVGAGIVGGVYIFFGQEQDSRQVEADAIHYKIKNCIENNNINWDNSQEELEKELFKTCSINEKVFKENFLMRITLNDELKYSWKGDSVKCASSEKNENFPKCASSSITKEFNNKIIELEILVGSSQYTTKKFS